MSEVLSRARELADKGYVRKWRVEGILYNIHGAYAKRTMKKQKKKESQRTKMQHREEEEGHQGAVLDTSSDTHTATTMEDEIDVHTFPHDANGFPLVPLGGPRGYLAGALKSAAKTYGTNRGQKFFGAQAHINRGGIVVKPEWIAMQAKEDADPVEYPTIMAGGGGRVAQVIYFDKVTKSPFAIDIYETASYKVLKMEGDKKAKEDVKEQPFTTVIMDEDDFLRLLGKVEDTPIGPKGRGTIEWTSIQKIE